MRKLIIIAAIGKNNELGYKNDLIWHFKEDLNNFKKLTNNHYILMGSNTYKSLPKKLINRKYLIISSKMSSCDDYLVFKNINDFLDFYKKLDKEVFIIGGASIYKEFINLADSLILTEINDSFDKADVYFPSFNKKDYSIKNLYNYEENNVKYSINEYKRL